MVQRIAFAILLSSVACFAQEATARFSTRAAWHRLLKKPVQGTLLFDDAGVEFQSRRFSHRWLYGEIRTFDLADARQLLITDYENRHWHEPGERQFRFTLLEAVSPELAATMTNRVGRPVINGDPNPAVAVLAEVPAHRRARFGGSNGKLRFRVGGIDYVTEDGRDSRSWRWMDIQTLANPNPWEFRVNAYREIVEFDLKQPLARDLFDTLWDHLYAVDLNLSSGNDAGRKHGDHQ